MSEQPDQVEREDSLSTIAAGEDQDLFIDDDLGTIFYDEDEMGSESDKSKGDDVKQDGAVSDTHVEGTYLTTLSSGTNKQTTGSPERPAKSRKSSWHCEESDKNHRSTMVLEMLVLRIMWFIAFSFTINIFSVPCIFDCSQRECAKGTKKFFAIEKMDSAASSQSQKVGRRAVPNSPVIGRVSRSDNVEK
jgi:hypothetical protein